MGDKKGELHMSSAPRPSWKGYSKGRELLGPAVRMTIPDGRYVGSQALGSQTSSVDDMNPGMGLEWRIDMRSSRQASAADSRGYG